MTGADVVFGLLGIVCLAAALLVVTARNVIHAALWLVVCFGALAGCYLVLTAEFVAWVQVLIYIGAVVVLMLFGAMLTRAPIGRPQSLDSTNRPVAALAGVATAGVLVTLVVSAFKGAYVDVHHTQIGDGHVLGTAVFRYFVLAFEVASVLLLAALVGAIVLTRQGRD
ncbi:MAG TPA: NADH-quinone oxidoreductase subunit J [Mycobacteriales bacterium]|jgi:NADH-quinone oxidoreductase subunit J|nr:NADH-quinone oxidoreductase subunit J [Mycobacteriales bacterium]